jgi:hypothetical protein
MGEPSEKPKWEGGEVLFTGGTDWAMVRASFVLTRSLHACSVSMADPDHNACSWDARVEKARLMLR